MRRQISKKYGIEHFMVIYGGHDHEVVCNIILNYNKATIQNDQFQITY